MKAYCSFMGFQEKELSPPQSGVEEDQGGVVTQPQGIVMSDHAVICRN